MCAGANVFMFSTFKISTLKGFNVIIIKVENLSRLAATGIEEFHSLDFTKINYNLFRTTKYGIEQAGQLVRRFRQKKSISTR